MIKAFIEIPVGSRYKYEFDKDSNCLVLDRPINQSIPANYGFIPETLEEDNDPLDIFVLSNNPLIPASLCKAEVIGVFYCEDNGVVDNKIISVLMGETIEYLDHKVSLIKTYLNTYKDGFKVISYGSLAPAFEVIEKCTLNNNVLNNYIKF